MMKAAPHLHFPTVNDWLLRLYSHLIPGFALFSLDVKRMDWRDAGCTLPVNPKIQDFFYTNGGDAVNCYTIGIIAGYALPPALALMALRMNDRYGNDQLASKITRLCEPKFARIFGAITSAATVIVVESTSIANALNTPDRNDIPVGIAGAAAFCLVDYALCKYLPGAVSTLQAYAKNVQAFLTERN